MNLLESEQTLVGILRYLCERLHPCLDDDPFGLPTMLQQQVDRTAARWPVDCRLVLQHAPQPIAMATQWEAFRITREALNNAIKHAAATAITVDLIYPEAADGAVQLIIRDNGRGMPPDPLQTGGLGIRNMIESARSVGGSLVFQSAAGGGTAIVFTFATLSEEALYAATRSIG